MGKHRKALFGRAVATAHSAVHTPITAAPGYLSTLPLAATSSTVKRLQKRARQWLEQRLPCSEPARQTLTMILSVRCRHTRDELSAPICNRSYITYPVKATDENMTSENWEVILNLCDKVGDEGESGYLILFLNPTHRPDIPFLQCSQCHRRRHQTPRTPQSERPTLLTFPRRISLQELWNRSQARIGFTRIHSGSREAHHRSGAYL